MVGALNDAAIRPSVCLSVCLSHAPSSSVHGAFYGYYYRTLIGNSKLEVEPTGQRGVRQLSRCRRLFRSICQVAAPSMCPSAIGGSISFRLVILRFTTSQRDAVDAGAKHLSVRIILYRTVVTTL